MVGPTGRWPLAHAGCSPSRAHGSAVMADASHTHIARRQPAQSTMLTIEACQMTPYVRDWTQSMAEQVSGIAIMCRCNVSAYKLCDPRVPAPLPVSSYAARACRLRQATGSGQWTRYAARLAIGHGTFTAIGIDVSHLQSAPGP